MQKQVYDYYSKKSNDEIIEWKKCRISGEEFPVFMSDKEFYQKIAPVFNGKKYEIPFPTLSPDLRHIRRMTFRNDRSLYHRQCDATGKNIISMFAPDKPYKVYDIKYWWGDEWNALDYGKEFDFSRSFFEQFDELFKSVPLPSLLNSNGENSDFVNQTDNMKNCYLEFSACDCENCYYGNRIFGSKYCIDCSLIYNSENCYECIDGEKLYKCFFSHKVKNCNNSYFLFDCINCNNCFLCWNLRNKSYCILNKEYSKEEYEKLVQEYKEKLKLYKNLEELKQFFSENLRQNAVFNYSYIDNSENVYGGFLFNSKNVFSCYEGGELEDCKYGLMVDTAKYVQDGNNSVEAEMQYEVSTGGLGGFRDLFCLDVWPKVTHSIYSIYCSYSNNLFGCVGLKNQEYCILNKKYTKEEYEKLVPKVIEYMMKTGEWGEFFPAKMSPFGLNESAAYEYYPFSKEKAIEYGFTWYDKNEGNNNSLVGDNVPNNIDDISKDFIENNTITCLKSGREFKVINQEFSFYKSFGIPLPRIHPDERHLDRFNKNPKRDLNLRKCINCSKEVTSVFKEDSELKVYCEECYNKKIY